MLQSTTQSLPTIYEDPAHAEALDLSYYFGILKKRILYFIIPFTLVLILGGMLVAIQRPLYLAEGKILVESPEIPANLVQPTVTTASTERIQVIQQRIMSRENLSAIVKKFALFPSQQRWMSSTQLLDLMRERASIELVDIDTAMAPTKDKNGKPLPPAPRQINNKNTALAFTISFEYEKPALAMKVANEFLTLILNEDIRVRTNRAAETTQFLQGEVKKLQGELSANGAQLAEVMQRPQNRAKDTPDQIKEQRDALTKMKTDLISTSSVYSEAHPRVVALKKRIAALEKQIAATPVAPSSSATETPKTPDAGGLADAGKPSSVDLDALVEQRKAIENRLEDATKKLQAARLGESMERDQQAERLQVIEQPALPQTPIKPNRPKLLAMVAALAMMVGAGTLGLAEILDKSIRGSRDLAGVVDSNLLVVIPYISTAGEIARRKRKIVTIWAGLAAVLVVGLITAYYVGVEIDTSWFDASWIDVLTRLTK